MPYKNGKTLGRSMMTNQRDYNEALLRLQMLLMSTEDKDTKLDLQIIIDILERTKDGTHN